MSVCGIYRCRPYKERHVVSREIFGGERSPGQGAGVKLVVVWDCRAIQPNSGVCKSMKSCWVAKGSTRVPAARRTIGLFAAHSFDAVLVCGLPPSPSRKTAVLAWKAKKNTRAQARMGRQQWMHACCCGGNVTDKLNASIVREASHDVSDRYT